MWKPEFRPAVVEPGEGIWPPGLHLHRLVTTYSHYMDVWQTCTQYYSTYSRVCNLLKNLSLIEENNTQITGSEELLSGRCILVNTFKNSPLDKDTKTSGVTLITSFGKWNETRRKTQNGDTWWTACPSPHTNNRTRQEFFFHLAVKAPQLHGEAVGIELQHWTHSSNVSYVLSCLRPLCPTCPLPYVLYFVH